MPDYTGKEIDKLMEEEGVRNCEDFKHIYENEEFAFYVENGKVTDYKRK